MDTDTWAVATPEIVERVGRLVRSEEDAALITVLDVERSAYRRPGAKMVVTGDGTQIGSVTAGCLESKFVDIATSVLETGTPRVETFDLTGEDGEWGLGVGCNGVITFLFEPLTEAYAPVGAAISADEPFALVATLDDDEQIEGRGVYSDDRGLVPVLGEFPPATVDRVRPQLEDALADGSTVRHELDAGEVFIDGIAPPPRLLILGHGNDVTPVVELGTKSGFAVEVVTFRGTSRAGESGARAVHTLSPTELTEQLALDPETYVVIMSHNFVDDRLAFETLLDSPVPYIGLLGPHKRFEEMVTDGEIQLTAEDRERIYTPIGVDIGGGSPYQIALSIVAEVLAVHNDREIKHLVDRERAIHDR